MVVHWWFWWQRTDSKRAQMLLYYKIVCYLKSKRCENVQCSCNVTVDKVNIEHPKVILPLFIPFKYSATPHAHHTSSRRHIPHCEFNAISEYFYHCRVAVGIGHKLKSFMKSSEGGWQVEVNSCSWAAVMVASDRSRCSSVKSALWYSDIGRLWWRKRDYP